MVSTFTPNIQLEEPARGDDVGTWDTPVNNNTTAIDAAIGGITSISLNNSNVVLSAAQLQSKGISFGSTLTGSVTITFATSFKKSYEIFNACTGSSAFTITLQTTASGGELIGCPPGEWFEIVNDGTNLRYKNFGRVGEYLDYAGSSNPAWNTLCTKPPYLNCDGSPIPAAYTVLPTILGSSLLPDSKGRIRAALDQSAGRLSSAVAGFSPNTVGSAGGSQNVHQHTHSNSLTDNAHTHNVTGPSWSGLTAGSGLTGGNGLTTPTTLTTGGPSVAPMSITNAAFGSGNSQNVQPTYIGGLTLIRAA